MTSTPWTDPLTGETEWYELPAPANKVHITKHSDLTGLDEDDHPQYLTTERADLRYVLLTDPLVTAAEINAELISLAASGGGTVQLVAGDYQDLDTITVPAYCTLVGVGWSGNTQGMGTSLKFNPGQDGIILDGPSARVLSLSVYSEEDGVGTAVGIKVRGAHCTLRDVNVQKFGSHGISVNSLDGPRNCNLARIDNVRSSYNGGCGLFIDGIDANAGYVTEINCSANTGAAQIFNEGCRWTIWAHIDSAGVGGTTDAIWDNGISNTYNVYIESSAAPGSNVHLGSTSTYGVLENLFYAEGIVVADTNTAFLSWRIYERDRYRFLEIGDTYQGRAGGTSWRFDSGITVGALRLQNLTNPRTVFTVAGDGTYMSFTQPLIPSPDAGVDLGRTANKWRDIFVANVVKLGAKTTANRPTAASAGAGGMMYDTTLSKPIWSDGTVWRDAAGTAV